MPHPKITPDRRRRRGRAIGVLALVVAALLLFHGLIPNRGGYASLAESFLPWLGLLIVPLALSVVFRFSRFSALGVAAAALTWAILFGPALLPSPEAGAPTLTVASENVLAGNPAVGEIAADLASHQPDVIALQELDANSRDTAADVLDPDYPHSVIVGTVGLWSAAPILDSGRLDLGLSWARALWVDLDTPEPTRVYAVHMDSIRPGESQTRDMMLAELAQTLAEDSSTHIVVLGDFNAASTDRAFTDLTAEITEASTSTFGLGFTWPATFPVARLDHVLTRGFTTVSSRVLDDNGSDHRGIVVELR